MQLSIIIPTKDRGRIFDLTLQAAVEASADLDAEVVVINDSKTGMPVVPQSFRSVKLLQNPGQGVASARNFGARNASGELILFLDDDIVISKKSLSHILGLHRDQRPIAVNPDWLYPPDMQARLARSAFGRFLESHQMTTFRGWYAHPTWRENELFPSLSVASFHLSLRREDFQKSGGYDEQFPMAGFEDYDFPKRLAKAGVTFFIDTRISVYHNEEDRLQLVGWLNNQERRGFTRAVAVRRGYSELVLHYPAAKVFAFLILLACHSLVLGLMRLLPDDAASRLIAALQAARIYKGYAAGLKS